MGGEGKNDLFISSLRLGVEAKSAWNRFRKTCSFAILLIKNLVLGVKGGRGQMDYSTRLGYLVQLLG